MAQTDTRSLQQIKRETEATRAGLTDTIEQLKTSVTETASDIRHRIRRANLVSNEDGEEVCRVQLDTVH
jgi:hypothetical protein